MLNRGTVVARSVPSRMAPRRLVARGQVAARAATAQAITTAAARVIRSPGKRQGKAADPDAGCDVCTAFVKDPPDRGPRAGRSISVRCAWLLPLQRIGG